MSVIGVRDANFWRSSTYLLSPTDSLSASCWGTLREGARLYAVFDQECLPQFCEMDQAGLILNSFLAGNALEIEAVAGTHVGEGRREFPGIESPLRRFAFFAQTATEQFHGRVMGINAEADHYVRRKLARVAQMPFVTPLGQELRSLLVHSEQVRRYVMTDFVGERGPDGSRVMSPINAN